MAYSLVYYLSHINFVEQSLLFFDHLFCDLAKRIWSTEKKNKRLSFDLSPCAQIYYILQLPYICSCKGQVRHVSCMCLFHLKLVAKPANLEISCIILKSTQEDAKIKLIMVQFLMLMSSILKNSYPCGMKT